MAYNLPPRYGFLIETDKKTGDITIRQDRPQEHPCELILEREEAEELVAALRHELDDENGE